MFQVGKKYRHFHTSATVRRCLWANDKFALLAADVPFIREHSDLHEYVEVKPKVKREWWTVHFKDARKSPENYPVKQEWANMPSVLGQTHHIEELEQQ